MTRFFPKRVSVDCSIGYFTQIDFTSGAAQKCAASLLRIVLQCNTLSPLIASFPIDRPHCRDKVYNSGVICRRNPIGYSPELCGVWLKLIRFTYTRKFLYILFLCKRRRDRLFILSKRFARYRASKTNCTTIA